MEKKVFAKEVNIREELLLRTNNAVDIIRQSSTLLERIWILLHRSMEKFIEVNGVTLNKFCEIELIFK